MDDQNPVFEAVARYFSMLGEPTRLKILHSICQNEKCVSDIIAQTGATQTNVSRHLGMMYQAGMLSRRREGNQIYYGVADQMFIELCRSVCQQISARQAGLPPTKKGFQDFLAEMNELADIKGKVSKKTGGKKWQTS